MSTYAVVVSGMIQNLIEWDGVSQWTPPQGALVAVCAVACGSGWTWNNGNPINPNPPPALQPPPPLVLTPAQGLAIIGLTVASLQAALGLSVTAQPT
jgi:hypothetical protein